MRKTPQITRSTGASPVPVGPTRANRAALDAAIELGIPHGGWCPRGRLAEDGRIPQRYNVEEMASPHYRVRTEQNVIDSDATLILYRHALRGGTAYTRRMAIQHDRPFVVVDLAAQYWLDDIRQWIVDGDFKVLNVAGPRGSSWSGIERQAYDFLVALLQH